MRHIYLGDGGFRIDIPSCCDLLQLIYNFSDWQPLVWVHFQSGAYKKTRFRQCNKSFRAFLPAHKKFLQYIQCNKQTHKQSGKTAKSVSKYNSHNSIHEKKNTLHRVNNTSKNTPWDLLIMNIRGTIVLECVYCWSRIHFWNSN